VPRIHLGDYVDALISWLLSAIPGVFDAISAVMTVLVEALSAVLTGPPFLVWVLVFTVATLLVRGVGLAAFTLVAFLLVASLDLWQETMETLAVVLVAAIIATAIGIPLGIWAARRRSASVVLRPILDFMQTTPVFVYLIPAVFFFGIGVVPGVVATTIFSIPPAVRLTELGIRGVDPEVVEAAHAFGAHPRQILREVQLPMARESLVLATNQGLLYVLSMVVIGGMVGGGSLGYIVVSGFSQDQLFGKGLCAGIAIAALGVMLDRIARYAAARYGR